MRTSKLFTTASLLLASGLAATTAHAGGQVQWQMGVETPVVRLPGHVVLPLPPIPVPRLVVTAPVYGGRDHRAPRRWDVDGDGIPNRCDRAYTPRWAPRWYRDGDGIPNRHDARPDDARLGHEGRDGRDGHAHRGWRDDHQRR